MAQDKPRIEVFRRAQDSRWLLSTYEGEAATAVIESIDVQLPLGEIYSDLP